MSDKVDLSKLSFSEILRLAIEPEKKSFTEVVREKEKPTKPKKVVVEKPKKKYSATEQAHLLLEQKYFNLDYFYSINIWHDGEIRCQGHKTVGALEHFRKLGFTEEQTELGVHFYRYPFVIILI